MHPLAFGSSGRSIAPSADPRTTGIASPGNWYFFNSSRTSSSTRSSSSGSSTMSTLFMNTDRKSTRLNSSHSQISYAVFCLKKKQTLQLAHAFGGSLYVCSAFDVEYQHAVFHNNQDVLSYPASQVFKFEVQEKLHNNIIVTN